MKVFERAELVMSKRDSEEGVRGYEAEVSRLNFHIKRAAFFEKDEKDVTSGDIREWLRQMNARDAAGRYGEPRKLAQSTIARCQSLLSAFFQDAVDAEELASNPCKGVALKKRVDTSDTRDKWAYLTYEEQLRLWACEAIPQRARLWMRIAAGTGMRHGEQANLELADFVVDGKNPHVNIRFSWPYKGKPSPPKSGKKRTVYLFGDALEAAREWLILLPIYAPYNPLGLAFPTPRGCRQHKGKPFGVMRVQTYYSTAGIELRPHLGWHSLRHTCASNLISGVLGRPWRLEEIQVVMGHATITMTQRYAHLGEDVIKRAVRETEEASTSSTTTPVETYCEPIVKRASVLTLVKQFATRVADRVKARELSYAEAA